MRSAQVRCVEGALSASGSHHRLWFLRAAADLDLDGLQAGT